VTHQRDVRVRSGRTALCRLLALVVVVLGALFAHTPAPAMACSCEYVAPLDARDRADAVLAGRVSEVAELGTSVVVTVDVATVWKGPVQSQVEILSQNPAADQCGAFFATGASYLFYTMQEGELLQRALCQRLVGLAEAGDDLALLGPGTAPAPQPLAAPQTPPVQLLLQGLTLAFALWGAAAFVRAGRRLQLRPLVAVGVIYAVIALALLLALLTPFDAPAGAAVMIGLLVALRYGQLAAPVLQREGVTIWDILSFRA
jgi:hypothetical protein